jgi:tRNA (cytidine/uridine-2'-O-)-methyltransferase
MSREDSGDRLRASPLPIPFRVVLVEPEIPPNTGNIARLTAATASELHLVGRLGFQIDEHAVRRAGLDYWHLVSLHQHVSYEHYLAATGGSGEERASAVHLFSAQAKRSYLDAEFSPGDSLVFGRESVGLPDEILDRHPNTTWGIPTLGAVRSLNLANAVSIVLYEALRRVGALDVTFSAR